MTAPLPTTDRRVLRDVAVGGAVGALSRTAVLAVAAAVGAGEVAGVVAVNLLGAALMGRLLTRSAADPRWVARHPLLATGVLGAFTTYSGLVVPLAVLVAEGSPVAAAVWGVGCLAVGVWLATPGRRGDRP